MRKIHLLSLLAAAVLSLSAWAQTAYITTPTAIYSTSATAESPLSFTDNGRSLQLSGKTLATKEIDSITFYLPDVTCVGGDISLLTEYEQRGAKYSTNDGTAISDVLTFFQQEGWNALRLRLFVNPANASEDVRKEGVVQDINYVCELGKRIKEQGFLLMLDFHYSDSWADPGKQTVPADWASLDIEGLTEKMYSYTKDCLTKMKDAGATPDFIQIGNEITYGLLWPTAHTYPGGGGQDGGTWTNLKSYLNNAAKACREMCPDAKIILHTELSNANNPANFYQQAKQYGIDYDIIGLSYYPAYHGSLSTLDGALSKIESQQPDRPIMIVETGYSNKWAMAGTTFDYTSVYPYSEDGQESFTKDLVTTLKKHKNVKGILWWWAEANEYGINWQNSVTSGWNNASLFNNETGRALKALSQLKELK